MTVKNPKAIYLGEWYIVEAPNEPLNASFETYSPTEWQKYNEEFSKALRWKVKEQEGFTEIMHESLAKIGKFTCIAQYEDWQPEQGRVYDLPKGYKVGFDGKCCVGLPSDDCGLCKDFEIFTILIPEEVKETQEKKYFNKIIEVVDLTTPLQYQAALKAIKALCQEYLNSYK